MGHRFELLGCKERAVVEDNVARRELAKEIQLGTADNLKRVKIRRGVDWFDQEVGGSPSWIEPFVEFKTVWHPVGA